MMAYLNPVETATDWQMPSGLYRYGSYLYLANAQRRYNAGNTSVATSQTTTIVEEESTEEEATEPLEETTEEEELPTE
jgi:penicillin-binding protein 1A